MLWVAVVLCAVVPRASADAAPRLHRLVTDVGWQHCEARHQGTTRPAWPCPTLSLLGAGKDLRVPETGRLAVALRRDAVPPGLTRVVVEAATYDTDGLHRVAATALERFDEVMETATNDRTLGRALAPLLGFEPVRPRQSELVDTVPETLDLHLGDAERGRKLAYAVWGWPATLPEARAIAFEPLRIASGDALALAFAVPEAGWAEGGAAVRFDLEASVDGGAARVLWSRLLDPARRLRDRRWQVAEVDLHEVARTQAGFTLRMRAEEPGTAAYGLWAAPALIRAGSDPRPNVLLVSLDTLRADRLGTHGYARPTTPFLDRLAAEGTLFERAISTFPSTTASHMSMLTSVHPCEHGVTAPRSVLPGSLTTLPQALAAGGYRTVAITENALIRGSIGFERGFDEYLDLVWKGEEPGGLFQQGIELARSWIARHGHMPFFMFLHTYQPHVPFKVPERHRATFVRTSPPSEMDALSDEYDAGVRGTDDILRDFLEALDRRGVLDSTLVVVTSDHGTEFGEHGGHGHARGVYTEQNHVPLIVRHPAVPAGRRIPVPISLVDLAPTILDATGVAAPASFRGRSLWRAITGDGESRDPAAAAVFSEQLWGPRQTALYDGRWAWVLTDAGLELYDMTVDSTQQRNLAGEDAARAAEGRRRIERIRATCSEDAKRLRRGGAESALPPERLEALRALGYAE